MLVFNNLNINFTLGFNTPPKSSSIPQDHPARREPRNPEAKANTRNSPRPNSNHSRPSLSPSSPPRGIMPAVSLLKVLVRTIQNHKLTCIPLAQKDSERSRQEAGEEQYGICCPASMARAGRQCDGLTSSRVNIFGFRVSWTYSRI